jgi:flavin reductase (DIM6/NTAB) family NADH-FMN oxidoreductase RutF
LEESIAGDCGDEKDIASTERRLPFAGAWPVVLLTTARRGKANVMAMSWHMMVDFEPPIVAWVISNRDYTFSILRDTKECVINIPTVELAKQVVGCGNTSGRDVDKLKKFRLTPLPAAGVGAPLISECYANLECKVIDTSKWTDTVSLSSRSSKLGSTAQRRDLEPFIIVGGAYSWSRNE